MLIIDHDKDVMFNKDHAIAEPLFVNENNRLLRFALLPGQEIKEHNSPSSPVFIKIIRGRGVFWGEDKKEQELDKDSVIVFKKGEMHGIKALDEELVFIAVLHGAP
jgi:quercetin dioxygenase-like cupin family protein